MRVDEKTSWIDSFDILQNDAPKYAVWTEPILIIKLLMKINTLYFD